MWYSVHDAQRGVMRCQRPDPPACLPPRYTRLTESRSSVRNTSALEADPSSCSRDLSFCAMSSLRAASVAPPFFDLLDSATGGE